MTTTVWITITGVADGGGVTSIVGVFGDDAGEPDSDPHALKKSVAIRKRPSRNALVLVS